MDTFLNNYKIIVAYEGTHYNGWQVQHNGLSIQACLQTAIQTITRSPVCVIGSGRTDAGVHAIGQVAHFHSPLQLNLYRFLGSLNGLLPRDIRVKQIEPVPMTFHAQYSALRKIYHYHLFLERTQDPFKRLYSYHVLEKINVDLLIHVAELFLGTHDFTSFANEAHRGTAATDPVRTMIRLDIIPEEGGVRLEFEADGFLYKMVRNIVGTALEVASGKKDLGDIPQIFDAKDRRKAGKAVPPHGLFLVDVLY